jgi:SAM-dependent methyltransferase
MMDSNAAAFTGSIPENYDRGLGPVIFADYAADIARRAAALRPKRVLETAAGTGIVTRQLRDLLPADTHLTVTDLNPPMLEVARGKLRPGEQAEFLPADATALPFPDSSFDAVVCQFGVMFFPDKPKSYAEVFRVLSPGGHYLFNVWDSQHYNLFARIVHQLVERLLPDDPPQFYKVPVSCHEIDPVKEALIAAGFTDINISVMALEKTIPDLEVFAHGVMLGNPLADQIRSRGRDPEQFVKALMEAFRAAFGAGSSRMPLQAIVYSARRPE